MDTIQTLKISHSDGLKTVETAIRYFKQQAETRRKEDRYCKNIFLAKPIGNRPRRRPPLRWIDCVVKYPNILKVKNWKTVAESRYARRKLLEKARRGRRTQK
ncbi:hypothetical protein TNCV_4726331 [Trichonephila clavipes]|nr:hypothetical protein TNCV_4726331 [Trichonephila clavipes]